jgi:predicted secreted protein
MLIQKPLVNRLTPAIREAQPAPGDGVAIIRPAFSFVGLPPEPTFRQTVPGAGVTQQSSFVVQQGAQVANAAQSIVTICRISAGYWRCKIRGAYRSNYVLATAQPGDMRILFADAVSNWQVVTRFAQLAGAQDIEFNEEFLVQNVIDVTAILDANGVGQEHIYSVHVWMQRLL